MLNVGQGSQRKSLSDCILELDSEVWSLVLPFTTCETLEKVMEKLV